MNIVTKSKISRFNGSAQFRTGARGQTFHSGAKNDLLAITGAGRKPEGTAARIAIWGGSDNMSLDNVI